MGEKGRAEKRGRGRETKEKESERGTETLRRDA